MACPAVAAITEGMRPSPAAVGDTLTCLTKVVSRIAIRSQVSSGWLGVVGCWLLAHESACSREW